MIELSLKCKCTDDEVKLFVRERGEDEDISDWMKFVQGQVGEWHRGRGCPEVKLEYMKIPLADKAEARIGERA